jgi:hypothetical protein
VRTALLLPALLLAACGSTAGGRDAGSAASLGTPVFASAPVELVGTVLDGVTGRPLAGCEVTGPGGLVGVTDAAGRFHVKGSVAGAEGELVATAPDGRTGSNLLRPLATGRLEVVIYVH